MSFLNLKNSILIIFLSILEIFFVNGKNAFELFLKVFLKNFNEKELFETNFIFNSINVIIIQN